MKTPFQRPEDDPQYRQLKPEYADALRQVGPRQYAFATARLFRHAREAKRPRFAVM